MIKEDLNTIKINYKDDEGKENFLYMSIEEWKFQQDWLEFRNKLLFMVGFKATDEQLKEAEEILFQENEKYRKFKI